MQMYTYVQSRFYRAPEVILQLPYGTPIDMWSLGCLLIELHTGEPIFNGSAQAKQLGRFFEVFGMLWFSLDSSISSVVAPVCSFSLPCFFEFGP